MQYAVLGIGRQGLSAVYDLALHCEATVIRAYDACFKNPENRQAVQSWLELQLGERAGMVQLLEADFAGRAQQCAIEWRGLDCVISALPYACNESVTRLAIEAAVPLCDMGGNPEMVERQRTLAVEHGHVVVPECGLAPGIANIFIKHLFEHHRCTRIRAYCGGLPADIPDMQDNPLQYQLLFSPEGLISEYMGMCPVLRNGRVDTEAALTGWESFDELHEAFYTSNNSPRILAYFSELGLRDCAYKTLRYHGHLEKIRVLRMLGFLSGGDNKDPELASRLRNSSPLQFDRTRDSDKVLLCVLGETDSGEAFRIDLVDHLCSNTQLTAMERTTSWGTTIVAHALASGRCRPRDFATPEQFMDTNWFIEQLKRRTNQIHTHV